MLYLVTIPIPNSYGDGVFEQPYYFSADKFPSWETIKTEIKKLHERDLNYPEYRGCHDHALYTLKMAEMKKIELPRLWGNLCQSAVPYEHACGHSFISARSIRPIVVEEPVAEMQMYSV
jgi:hypothetical protein